MSNEYLEGNFTPVSEEVDLPCTEVEGTIPTDIAGYFLRTGPNNQFEPIDPALYHPFDGDGMIHQIEFADGRATYRNRWVRTPGFLRERKEGKSIWGGFNTIGKIEAPADMPMKNLSNTAMAVHRGQLLSTWEGGSPFEVRLSDLETVGEQTWDGGWTQAVTAHPKVDPRTGELIVFCYNPAEAPYVRHGVVDRSGKVIHKTGIDLQGSPVMVHDMAITRNHSLIFDMPVTFSIERIMNGGKAFDWEPDNGTRIGVVPRYGEGRETRWFDVDTGYIFHVFNAWEEGDEIVLDACRTIRTTILDSEVGQLDELNARMHRYRLNLTDGSVEEHRVDETPLEFSRINENFVGEKTRFGYASRFHPDRGLLFNAMIKHDRQGDHLEILEMGDTQFNQEIVFAPRVGSTEEDDGYVVGFVHDESDDHTECWVVDARRFTEGPIARIRTPRRVPYVFHSHWAAS